MRTSIVQPDRFTWGLIPLQISLILNHPCQGKVILLRKGSDIEVTIRDTTYDYLSRRQSDMEVFSDSTKQTFPLSADSGLHPPAESMSVSISSMCINSLVS